MRALAAVAAVCLAGWAPAARAEGLDGGPKACATTTPLPEDLRSNAARLLTAALADEHDGFGRLATLTDTFGSRFSGSRSLENAINWILKTMQDDGLQNVRGEPVLVPHWVRGSESLDMLEPFHRNIPVLGLGGTVATPADGISAPILVVHSFDDLRAHRAEAKGRIVVWNVPFTNYGETVAYRMRGAIEAASAGAVASLLRSVTPSSLRTLHTGMMEYEDATPKIPHAAITVEDAERLQRLQDSGSKVKLWLRLDDHLLPDAPSRNVVAEVVGREKPEETVVIGGHIDSWDVGDGAMDDGGGAVAAWEAVRLIHVLGLQPRRTIRVVLWTNEENGLRGGRGYRDAHVAELARHVAAIESDSGVFKPKGFRFVGSEAALAMAQPIAPLLETIGAGQISAGGGDADISPLTQRGVPGFGLEVDGSRYFWFHHSVADTIDKLDSHEFAQCVAAMAVLAWALADMPDRLPASPVKPDGGH
jgi:carboxypeptidase Q